MDHLPLVEKTYELSEELCRCPACQKVRDKIGTEISYTVEYTPASFLRIKHIQCKYACRACDQNGHSPEWHCRASAGFCAHRVTVRPGFAG
jgi:transposase